MKKQLSKLQILAYTDENFRQRTGSFTVQLNPEQITRTYAISYKDPKIQGKVGAAHQIDRVEPQEVVFAFIIDGSGVVTEDNSVIGNIVRTTEAIIGSVDTSYVTRMLEAFRKEVFDYLGVIHRPPFVLVSYGEEFTTFAGVIRTVKVNLPLLNPDGSPLRAEVEISVIEHLSPEAQAAKQRNSSPDLTHVRTVRRGDTILLMTDTIYGDARHYLEVARANHLDQFRDLPVGTNLIFPPLSKTN